MTAEATTAPPRIAIGPKVKASNGEALAQRSICDLAAHVSSNIGQNPTASATEDQTHRFGPPSLICRAKAAVRLPAAKAPPGR